MGESSENNDKRQSTYEIIQTRDGPAIKCLRCGRTSYNPNDVRMRYCGNCHVFHDL